jgi:hypothetical protein
MGKVIYIEGTQELDNGDLRKAFAKVFEKELKGNMPRIVMGNGKNQTIDKFHSTPLGKDESRFLLVDSDGPVKDKMDVCTKYNQQKPNRKQDCTKNNTYLMIQEAEAWILSQPEVLEHHKVNTKKLPECNAMEIDSPSDKLAELYKNSGLEYHKVRDFSQLFPDLDTVALKKYFSEFRNLMAALS